MDHLRDRHGAALSVCRPFRPDSLANVSRGGALRARPWLPSGRAFGATCARYLLTAPAALSCARYLLTAPSALPDTGAEFRFCLALHDHESNIIGGARALRELRQGRLDAIANARSRRVNIARDDFVKTRRTKLFTSRTHRFSHTIRIDH